jgi:hypothetical protein
MEPRNEASVTRTYRTAIRVGDDYLTLEETITLPLDADEAEIKQAVELGWRIYTAQQEAVSQQVAAVREAQGAYPAFTMRDPEAPASEKQRNYIAALQDDLTWSNEQLTTYAGGQGIDLVTLTKGQASQFIDTLKKMAEERPRYGEPAENEALSERQHQALLRLAEERGLDLEREVEQRFNLTPAALSNQQASALISEWQAARSPRGKNGRRSTTEAAL